MKMDTPPVTVKKTLSNSLTKNSLTPCRRVGLGRPSSGSLNKLVQVKTISTPLHESDVSKQNSLPDTTESCMRVTPASGLPLRVSLKQNYEEKRETTKVRRCLAQNIKSKELQSVKRAMYENEVETNVMLKEVEVKCDRFGRDSYHSRNSQVKKFKSELSSPISSNTNAEVGLHENNKLLVFNSDSTNTLADCSMFDKNKEVSDEMIAQLLLSLLEKKNKLDQLKVQETYAKKHNLEELRAQTATWRTAGQEALRLCVRLARQAGYSVTVPQLMQQHGFPPDLMGYNSEDDEFE